MRFAETRTGSTSVTPQNVCVSRVCVRLRMLVRKMHDWYYGQGHAVNIAVLSGAYTLIDIFEKINDSAARVLLIYLVNQIAGRYL